MLEMPKYRCLATRLLNVTRCMKTAADGNETTIEWCLIGNETKVVLGMRLSV